MGLSTGLQSRDKDAGVRGLIAQRKHEVPAASCPEDASLEGALPKAAASASVPASTRGPERGAGVKNCRQRG